MMRRPIDRSHLSTLIGVLAAGLLLTSCGSDEPAVTEPEEPSEPGPLASVEVDTSSVTVGLSAVDTVSAVARDADGTTISADPEDVTWTSANPNVATVDPEGRVTGQRTGQAAILAEMDGVEGPVRDHVLVTVIDPDPTPVSEFRVMEIPTECTQGFQDVWGSAPDDVWAVTRKLCPTEPASGSIFRYDGDTWSKVRDVEQPLYGVWGSGPEDVWAVGGISSRDTSITTVAHYDGDAWQASETPSDSLGHLLDVWGSGPEDVWMSGPGGTLHTDGRTWTRPSSSRFPVIAARTIWGSGPDDVWFVGNPVYHFNGVAWEDFNPPASLASLFDIWGAGAENVWTVGCWPDMGTCTNDTRNDEVAHYDGSEWRKVATPTGGEESVLRWVWGTGPTDVWVGGVAIEREEFRLYRYDGVAWGEVGTAGIGGVGWAMTPGDMWIMKSDAAIQGIR